MAEAIRSFTKNAPLKGAFFVVINNRMRYDGRIMQAIINLYKPQGMTPLQALHALREMKSEYRGEKMTYAGRLDPMAEGVLIVLVGDAVHKKEYYCGLEKTYVVDVLFGLGTDTHDLLGMPIRCPALAISDECLQREMNGLGGVHKYPFPVYSSKPVRGKPLFQWAREGRLNEVDIPKRIMDVRDMRLLERYTVTANKLEEMIQEQIGRVSGDFRQHEVLDRWCVLLNEKRDVFQGVRVTVRCASGTYIRTIAHELGKRLGTGAVVTRLVRTQVGEYGIEESMEIDKGNVLKHTIK